MGVVGTYTGHRRPDKLVSGSAFEEVSVCRSEVSAVGSEFSNPGREIFLPFSFIFGSQEGTSALLDVSLALRPPNEHT